MNEWKKISFTNEVMVHLRAENWDYKIYYPYELLLNPQGNPYDSKLEQIKCNHAQ